MVGAELRQKAILLTVLGLLFQLIYIAVRFKGGIWGAAAAIAAASTTCWCASRSSCFFSFEITLNVIAALLTLVGYSVNDTIVIFDRVRENMKHRRKEPMAKILNDSLNQTLTRTLISNGTTFLAVLGLFLFGGEVLAGSASPWWSASSSAPTRRSTSPCRGRVVGTRGAAAAARRARRRLIAGPRFTFFSSFPG